MIKKYTWDWFSYLIITLNMLTTILHSVGALVIIRRQSSTLTSGSTSSQSQSTRIKNNVELLSMSIAIIASTTVSTFSITMQAESIGNRFAFPMTASLLLPFYCSMIFLTLQRFFAISLHLRYESSWIHLQRVNITLASWIVGLIFMATTLSFVYNGTLLNCPIVGVIIFGLLATNAVFITVYIYIYIKYREATENTQKTLYKRKRTKIFIPFIICASFFLFGTLPHAFMPQINDSRYSYLWFNLDCITNSLVYIFANRELSRRCTRWLAKRRGRVIGDVSNNNRNINNNNNNRINNNNITSRSASETATASV